MVEIKGKSSDISDAPQIQKEIINIESSSEK